MELNKNNEEYRIENELIILTVSKVGDKIKCAPESSEGKVLHGQLEQNHILVYIEPNQHPVKDHTKRVDPIVESIWTPEKLSRVPILR